MPGLQAHPEVNGTLLSRVGSLSSRRGALHWGKARVETSVQVRGPELEQGRVLRGS